MQLRRAQLRAPAILETPSARDGVSGSRSRGLCERPRPSAAYLSTRPDHASVPLYQPQRCSVQRSRDSRDSAAKRIESKGHKKPGLSVGFGFDLFWYVGWGRSPSPEIEKRPEADETGNNRKLKSLHRLKNVAGCVDTTAGLSTSGNTTQVL